MIVVDTLRADHLGLYGYERATSPELDAWAKRGRVYEHVWSTSSWTLPSVGSILTGMRPNRHRAGLRTPKKTRQETGSFEPLAPEVATLAERLSSAGYQTGAIVASPYVRKGFGFARGFSSYRFESATLASGGGTADKMVDRALAWIDAHDDAPFFLYLHMLDPHVPYQAPPEIRGQFDEPGTPERSYPVVPAKSLRSLKRRVATLREVDRVALRNAYDEEIVFTDRELGRFLTGLEDRGVLERGMVLLTADHGEELLEHGKFEHGHAMWESLLHVPLLIWGREVQPGREPMRVSIVDVTPTVLSAADVELPPELQGISLWANATKVAPLPERTLLASGGLYGPGREAAMTWPYKLERVPGGKMRRLANLATDPAETEDRFGQHAEIEASLIETIETTHQGDRIGKASAAAPISEDTRQELEALGYAP